MRGSDGGATWGRNPKNHNLRERSHAHATVVSSSQAEKFIGNRRFATWFFGLGRYLTRSSAELESIEWPRFLAGIQPSEGPQDGQPNPLADQEIPFFCAALAKQWLWLQFVARQLPPQDFRHPTRKWTGKPVPYSWVFALAVPIQKKERENCCRWKNFFLPLYSR